MSRDSRKRVVGSVGYSRRHLPSLPDVSPCKLSRIGLIDARLIEESGPSGSQTPIVCHVKMGKPTNRQRLKRVYRGMNRYLNHKRAAIVRWHVCCSLPAQ